MLVTGSTVNSFLLVLLQNPNALDSKVLLEFDHVKNSLKLDDEGVDLSLHYSCDI